MRLAAPFIGVTLLLAGAFLGAGPGRAARTPSPELSFRVTLTPDSIAVGDPIEVVVEAAGPAGAVLLLPQFADSVGPFTVLDAGPLVAGSRDGKVTLRQTAKVTRFRTGPASFPDLPLLWVRGPGDTAVAHSAQVPVRVGSLLTGPPDAAKLHDLKPVVPLGRLRWWLWGLIAIFAAAVAFAAWRYRHLLRRHRVAVEPPPPPPLPPEVAFERGLAALLAQRLPELGRVKDYYGELSLLFRRYIEDRYGFPAVEETRREIMGSVKGRTDFRAEETAILGDWLAEDEMVKFAKLERLLGEVAAHTDRACVWVRATTPPVLGIASSVAGSPSVVPSAVTPFAAAPTSTAISVPIPGAPLAPRPGSPSGPSLGSPSGPSPVSPSGPSLGSPSGPSLGSPSWPSPRPLPAPPPESSSPPEARS